MSQSQMTQEHFLKYLKLRQINKNLIGAIWVEQHGYYIRPPHKLTGDPDWISEAELARTIDRIWDKLQTLLPFEEGIACVSTTQIERNAGMTLTKNPLRTSAKS